MKPTPDTYRLIKFFAKGLKSLVGEYIEKIILFGSYARGEQTDDSDIDVVVLLKISSNLLTDQIYDYLVDFMLEYNIDISLKLIDTASYKSWQKQGEPLIKAIETEGIDF